MLAVRFRVIASALVTLASIPSCVSGSAPAKLPAIKTELQLEISNSNVNVSGTGTWNATCKGRIYLCAAVSSGNQAFEYSCAPVAQ